MLFRRQESDSQPPESKEFDVNSLPLPPTYDEVIQENPDLSPISEEDWQRMWNFFQEQVPYFQSKALESQQIGNEIHLERAQAYTQWSGQIEDIYHLLRENVRIITEPLFYEALEKVRQQIQEFVGDERFLIYLHGDDLTDAQHHSTYFIAQALGIPESNYITEKELAHPGVQEFIRQGGKIVIADDAAYLSQNVGGHIRDIQEFSTQNENIFVGLVGTTAYAAKHIQEYGVTFSAQYRIPELREIFKGTGLSYDMLRLMNRPLNDPHEKQRQIPIDGLQVLTLFYQKVPDNFAHPLRKWSNSYWDDKEKELKYFRGYLVNDIPGGIYPSYRKAKKYVYS